MKLKLIAASAVSALATVLLLHAQNSSPAPSSLQLGRFQIFQFDYNAYAGSVVKDTAVFRIDTQTGQTWKYHAALKDGQIQSFWTQIDETHLNAKAPAQP